MCAAIKKHALVAPKTKKNIERDSLGNTLGTVHMGRQDLTTLVSDRAAVSCLRLVLLLALVVYACVWVCVCLYLTDGHFQVTRKGKALRRSRDEADSGAAGGDGDDGDDDGDDGNSSGAVTHDGGAGRKKTSTKKSKRAPLPREATDI